jgi:predicted HTH transcriptional regulator
MQLRLEMVWVIIISKEPIGSFYQQQQEIILIGIKQEQQKIIETQQSEIDQLKKEMNEIKSMLGKQ